MLYASMVKWLRRCPLTAESGVRVPLGVPTKNTRIIYSCVLFLLLNNYLNAIGLSLRANRQILIVSPKSYYSVNF